MSKKTSLALNHVEQVCKAEIFSSFAFCSLKLLCFHTRRFKLMFPSCPIAQFYAQADTKVRYNLQ